ncbi:MAG: hypothetical protein HN333_14850 [Rhodospirillaceae bacterium]|nr:hypothetical protein [Rhodospirillaceae bacterium]
MNARTSFFWALFALTVLGGCATKETPPPETKVDAAETASLPTPVEAAQPIIAPAEPEEPVPAMESLQGLDSNAVTALLGAPHFQRVDNPAEIWQYRRNGCVLDLFLYPASNGALAVDHLETRHFEVSDSNPQSCFATMVRAARETG